MSLHGVTHRFLATDVSELHNMENALFQGGGKQGKGEEEEDSVWKDPMKKKNKQIPMKRGSSFNDLNSMKCTCLEC
jgi:hypothetical protein